MELHLAAGGKRMLRARHQHHALVEQPLAHDPVRTRLHVGNAEIQFTVDELIFHRPRR